MSFIQVGAISLKWVAYEVRDGVGICVVYEPATLNVITPFPDNGPIAAYEYANLILIMYCDRILKFGERFRERLNPVLVQGALDYVGFGEEGLAFEILCDHLCECDVSITEDEYHEAVKLALDMGFDLGAGPFMHLKNLRS